MSGRYWTTAEVRLLRELYPSRSNPDIGRKLGRTEPAVMIMALKLGLRKSPQFIVSSCRFQQGRKPWNAGLVWDNAGGRATRFRKGHRGARQKPVGTERVERDGVFIKIAEPNVWEAKARIVWRTHFGEIPQGHVVRLKNGDKLNCSPENLMLVSRAENARLNARIRKTRQKRTGVPAWMSPLGVAA